MTFNPSQARTKMDKAKREELHKSTILGMRLPRTDQGFSQHLQHLEKVSRLRSFILSHALHSHSNSNSANECLDLTTTAKWANLAPTLVKRASLLRPVLDSLKHIDKYISPSTTASRPNSLNDLTTTPEFHAQFSEKNLLITTPMLRDAAKFKIEVLDVLFSVGNTFPLPKTARVGAGEMLALMQLLGDGKIEIRPGEDIPRSRYGVEWERVGYETRKLRKASFNYGVVASGTDRYTYGARVAILSNSDRIKRSVNVEGGHSADDGDDGDGGDGGGVSIDIDTAIPLGHPHRADTTPIWTNPLNNPIKATWETILASVLGILSLRPGVDAAEISKCLGNAVGEWEVEIILRWAEKRSFVERTKEGREWWRGWRTRDGWWLCLA